MLNKHLLSPTLAIYKFVLTINLNNSFIIKNIAFPEPFDNNIYNIGKNQSDEKRCAGVNEAFSGIHKARRRGQSRASADQHGVSFMNRPAQPVDIGNLNIALFDLFKNLCFHYGHSFATLISRRIITITYLSMQCKYALFCGSVTKR